MDAITGGEEDRDLRRGGRWRFLRREGRWRLEERRKMAVITGGICVLCKERREMAVRMGGRRREEEDCGY